MGSTGFVSRFLTLFAVAAWVAMLSACGGGGDGGGSGGEPVRTVSSVTATSPTLTPKQGDTIQLTAVARDQFGEVVPGKAATWASSAPDVVLQFPAPIGFRYDSVTCRSSGTVVCPAVSVQQLAGGVLVLSFPPSSELAFTFEGVTTGDVGTQVAIAGVARSDYKYWEKDLSSDSAQLYIPIVAPAAPPPS